jgi:uncharacterized membrane protein
VVDAVLQYVYLVSIGVVLDLVRTVRCFRDVAEITVGLGLLVPRTRSYAAWATIALLIAIYPANVHMVTIEVAPGAGDPSVLPRWVRLPLQGVLILWAYWYTE